MKQTLLAVSLLTTLSGTAFADLQQATAITETSGGGQVISQVALHYAEPLKAVSQTQFAVSGRTVTGAHRADGGRVVMLNLSAQDPNAMVLEAKQRAPYVEKPVSLTVQQTAGLSAQNGQSIAPKTMTTDGVEQRIVDDFRQLEFRDPQSGTRIKYNLYVPKDYDANRSYPLVMFIHDAGTTNDNVRTTLLQGNGATAFAAPEWQAKQPAFVLAPQFDHEIVNDNWDAPADLDPTINLIKSLMAEYNIDGKRLYTTGQSGGGMLSIAMNIKYPDFFAASYIVAAQWDPAKVAPMAKNNIFVMVSADDPKAFPTENAMMKTLAGKGALIAEGEIPDGGADVAALDQAVNNLLKNKANIYYMVIRSGTLPYQKANPDHPGAAHLGTWKVAYNIDAVKDWLFAQHK